MAFLRSKYLLLVIAVLVLVEAAMRLGAYEPLVLPASHSGSSIRLKQSLHQFGHDQIEVVTLGDSRAAQGLDHGAIFDAADARGVVHVQMTKPGSHFLTFKTLVGYAREEFPNLEGIVFAFSPANFGALGWGAHEAAIVLPFRSGISAREMLRHIPFESSDPRTWAALYTMAGYRDDIHDFLANPGERWQRVRRGRPLNPLPLLRYKARVDEDVCAIPINEADACLEALASRGESLSPAARDGLNRICRAATRPKPAWSPGEEDKALVREWTRFMEGVAARYEVFVVLMPDLEAFQKNVFLPNAQWVVESVMEDLHRRDLIRLVDYRYLMQRQESPECGFFADSVHLNLAGQERLSESLLRELDAFWSQLPQ